MVDEYQIVEARAHRADAILLIAAALTDAEMKRFAQARARFSLDVLVEVHTADELDRVLDALGEDRRRRHRREQSRPQDLRSAP